MNYATNKGLNKNMAYAKFKVFREEMDVVYLTEDELMKIYNLQLDSKALEYIRDGFCFSCFTGLRFSDLSQIKPEYIKDDYLIINTIKTREKLQVPLNYYSKEILSKYKAQYLNSFPPVISNQKTNENLKIIAEKADLKEPVSVVKYSGSRKIETLYPKHELITTHTARRTFVTLALEKGIRPEVVMAITGHKDYRTFKKYIKITDKVKLNEMNRLWQKVA
jgi:integrase